MFENKFGVVVVKDERDGEGVDTQQDATNVAHCTSVSGVNFSLDKVFEISEN